MKSDRSDLAKHERRDVSASFGLIGASAVVWAVCLLAIFVIWLFPHSLADQHLRLPLYDYPSPRLQQDPRGDLSAFMEDQQSRLNGSGWIDEDAGVEHIPIEQAMRQIGEEKIPDWPDEAHELTSPEPQAQESDHAPKVGKTAAASISVAHRRPRRSGGAFGVTSKAGRTSAARRHRY